MVCAHAPNLDPRIRWEAEAAASRFEVTVLGFAPEGDRDGSASGIECCQTVLCPRRDYSALRYLWTLAGIAPAPYRLLGGVLLAALSPALFLADVAARLAAPMVRRRLRPAARSGAAAPSADRAASALDDRRALLPARLYYVLTSLRQRFSPATVEFYSAIRAMPKRPDVIHCNDLDTLLVGVLAKRAYRCRLIYDAHEFFPHSDPAGRWLDIGFFSFVERVLIRRADAVVSVNPLLGKAIRDAYGLTTVHAVANAEPWLEARSRPTGSEMERLAHVRVKFLFQGRFAAGRGIEEMIVEWAAVNGERAALFLRGPENKWRTRAIGLAGKLGVLNRSVYFLDAVGEDELVAAAAEADVGIIPYRPVVINDRLSCPNKLSQYLHAGLMVIANDLPYVKSVLGEAEAGLFYDSATPGTLAQAVSRVLADPDLLPRAQANALRFARERFNWQVEGEKLYALYGMSHSAITPRPRPVVAPVQ